MSKPTLTQRQSTMPTRSSATPIRSQTSGTSRTNAMPHSSTMSKPGPRKTSQGDIDKLMVEIKASLNKDVSPVTLADADFSIPEDISHIQNIHDVIVQDFEELKKTIERYIGIVDKTELIMNILNYKQYELTHTFRTEFEGLMEKKKALTEKSVDLDEQSKVALQVVEIEDQIEYLTEDHHRALDSLKEQKIDAQREYEHAIAIMDDQFDKMRKGFQKLLLVVEAENTAIGEPQAALLEEQNAAQLESVKNQLDKYAELQNTGWKILYPEEKISATLQERGLKVSVTGMLITEEGREITLDQAQQGKLLDGMEAEAITTIRQSIGQGSKTHRKAGDTHSSKSGSSASSKMSSEDVCYLKTCLGKPLTLALAEITAVQPRDPIHYLGHWLFKFRYNQQMEDVNNMEFEALNELRIKLAQERWHKFIEEEARTCVIDMIIAAEEIAMMNELRRIQREAEAMEEEEMLVDEARDVLGTYKGPTSGQVPL